ncbi:ATP-binding protein [Aquisalimonas sp.]|uniref:sensor histidine kinase n=1 Tax=Aquisalimonas sp. TaxID=1872621 RepID=UPI0025BAEC74|nr:ATP-binding protein [Aquisalimonas sp.]
METTASPSDGTPFDRELPLSELFAYIDGDALLSSLMPLAGGRIGIRDAHGQLFLGCDADNWQPLELEWEVVGYLGCAEADAATLRALAGMVEVQLRTARRIQMVSDLHHGAVEEDYRRLKEKNEQLQASEERYRCLAASLEQRVQAQLKTLQENEKRLAEARRLASMGHLAAGIAHEVNNPLGFINANLRSATRYVEQLRVLARGLAEAFDLRDVRAAWERADMEFLLEDFPDLLDESQQGVVRIGAIVSALRGLTDASSAQMEPLQLGTVLGQVYRRTEERGFSTAMLRTHVDRAVALHANLELMQQALAEVLINALQACDGRGEVTIETRREDGTEEQCGWLELAVVDSGAGMTPETLEHAFDPFYTTRAVGSGVGLGLTVSREIILAHGGGIALHSDGPETGTTARIRLPLHGGGESP